MAGRVPLTKDPDSNAVWLDLDVGEGWRCRYQLVWAGRAVVAGIEVSHDGPVPPGGLTARHLRRLRLTLPWERFPQLDDAVASKLGVGRRPTIRLGLDALDPKSEPLRPGRRGRSDLFLALVAVRYTGLVEDNDRSPFKTLAAELRARGFNFRESSVKGFIVAARDRGFLTSPPVPGAAGGDLTAKAEEILLAHAEKQLDKKPVSFPKGQRHAKQGAEE